MNLNRWNLENTDGREIVTTKVFDEPPDFVFKMYTRPEYVDQWWGPHGYTTRTITMDFRSGGSWRYQMIASDGTIFDNVINYVQIKPNEEIIYTLSSVDDHEHEFLTIISFTPHEVGTKLRVQMVFKTPEDYNHAVENIGAERGLQQTLYRLESQLKRQFYR